jgi:secretion/DNA translocation related TadE-like protein
MTVFVVLALTIIVFAGTAVTLVTGIIVGHRRAQSAADLTALAAADAARRSLDACAAAVRLAAANQARVELCRSEDAAVRVVVSVQGPVVMGRATRLMAEARAGW